MEVDRANPVNSAGLGAYSFPVGNLDLASALADSGTAAWHSGDRHTAIANWTAAAESGLVVAMVNLAVAYESMSDVSNYLVWAQRAAEAGDVDSAYNVGATYDEMGNTEQAIRWWRKAADAGDPLAMRSIGNTYFNKLSSRTEAKAWWEKAADAGEPGAMRNLASVSLQGGDRSRAIWWLLRAAEAGDESARAEASRLQGS